MTMGLTRRGLLAGGVSAWAGLAAAQGFGGPRPLARPGPVSGALAAPPATGPLAREELGALVRRFGLDGHAGVALVDLDDGTLLAGHDPGLALPPASVAKAVTAAYALDALGPGHRFATRLLATGPVEGGVVQGDLVLVGGGDPVLVTDRLAVLARALAEAGVTGARGFRVWGGQLPAIREIAGDQLPQLGYNPAVGGLNLNFNRVFFEWARQGGDYRVSLDARGDAHRPAVAVARIRVEPRDRPVYTYEAQGDVDSWTVAGGQLGQAGNRWLPVRNPDLYAGQAFLGLAAEAGVTLPAPARAEGPPEGTEIARIDSAPLEDILRDMLLFSTNPTAEVVGLAASIARGLAPAALRDSAAAMNAWVREATGARMALVDHSGLGVESRVAPAEMALFLASRGTAERLRPLLRGIELTDAAGDPLAMPPALVRAKTGTLNFVSALAGYVRTLDGTDLAFAVFAGDVAARAAAAEGDEEVPEGSRDFLARARRLQQVLVQRWGRIGA